MKTLNTEFIKGMGKHNEQFIIILDIDRVFSADELTLVGAAGAQPATAEEEGVSVPEDGPPLQA